MKLCISSQGVTPDAQVDPRFGRCRSFIFVDLATGALEAQENPYAASQGGAGIQAAQFAASKGAQAVITGNVGPNAFRTLAAAGITVFAGVSGTVAAALEQYKAGKLTAAQDASVSSKFGTGT